jgi:hypothetical protein
LDDRKQVRPRISFLGWSLIVVVLIFATTVAIPNFFRAKITHDEESPAWDIRTLLTAEISYASLNPKAGFTCNLSDLRELVGSKLGSGRSVGYVFTLQNCRSQKTGEPISRFQVIATPERRDSASYVVCSDQTGVVRQDPSGSSLHCLEHGAEL